MSDYFGKNTFKLGFGLMRLPKTADEKNDVAQVSRMADAFLAAGGTYFDAAFVKTTAIQFNSRKLKKQA